MYLLVMVLELPCLKFDREVTIKIYTHTRTQIKKKPTRKEISRIVRCEVAGDRTEIRLSVEFKNKIH